MTHHKPRLARAQHAARPLATALALAILAAGSLPARASALDDAAEAYKEASREDIDNMTRNCERLVAALKAGDIAAARQAWVAARVGYERSETFVEPLFPKFDAAIDSWPDATAGFHAVEAKLFVDGAPLPIAEAEALLQSIKGLQAAFPKEALTGEALIGGVASLAFEIGESKAKGGESRASGTSLDDMRHNAEGIERAWNAVFASDLAAKDPALAGRIRDQLAAVKSLLAVASLDKLDPSVMEMKSEMLAGSIADAAVKLGYPAPKFEEEGEGQQAGGQ